MFISKISQNTNFNAMFDCENPKLKNKFKSNFRTAIELFMLIPSVLHRSK